MEKKGTLEFDESTGKFVIANEEENTILLKVINSYNLFKVSYDNCLNMNHDERML